MQYDVVRSEALLVVECTELKNQVAQLTEDRDALSQSLAASEQTRQALWRQVRELTAEVKGLEQERDSARQQVLVADDLLVKLTDCRVVCSQCSEEAMAFRVAVKAWLKAPEDQSDAGNLD